MVHYNIRSRADCSASRRTQRRDITTTLRAIFPGRKPPFWAEDTGAMRSRFTMEGADGAQPPGRARTVRLTQGWCEADSKRSAACRGSCASARRDEMSELRWCAAVIVME